MAAAAKILGPLLAVGAVACTPVKPAPSLPTGAEGRVAWRQARSAVETLRARFEPTEPYSMNVSLELTQMQLGQRMRARGAVAVHPPDALRMILLGPGGTTALDLWICRDQYRFSVPAIDLERRGDATTPERERRGLPVDFLRWWFLRPFAGDLLSFVDGTSGRRYVLRDAPQVIHLLAPTTGVVTARRLSRSDEERLDVTGDRCGDVRYRQRSTGIDISVGCEQVNARKPPPRAFADPDDPREGCVPAGAGADPEDDFADFGALVPFGKPVVPS